MDVAYNVHTHRTSLEYRATLVGKLLSRSTRFTCFCAAQTSIFQQKIVEKGEREKSCYIFSKFCKHFGLLNSKFVIFSRRFLKEVGKREELGKFYEFLKIENTRVLRRGRKNPTFYPTLDSTFVASSLLEKGSKISFEGSHLSAVIMRSLSSRNSWSCLPCRLFQL